MWQVTLKVLANRAELRCLDKDGQIHIKQIAVAAGETKNRTTLMAVIEILEHMTRPAHLILKIDNPYVSGALANDWPQMWKDNEWHTAKGKDIANKALWIYCMELLWKHEYEVAAA